MPLLRSSIELPGRKDALHSTLVSLRHIYQNTQNIFLAPRSSSSHFSVPHGDLLSGGQTWHTSVCCASSSPCNMMHRYWRNNWVEDNAIKWPEIVKCNTKHSSNPDLYRDMCSHPHEILLDMDHNGRSQRHWCTLHLGCKAKIHTRQHLSHSSCL